MGIKHFVWILLLLAVPVSSYGQSTLNFPKLFTAAELPGTGFAVVNPGSTAASLTFTLYSASGVAVPSTPRTIAAGGQLAILGNELFPNPGSGGWVRATSLVTGLQGFWLIFNGNLTSIDGAEAAATATDLVIPLVAGQTELNVANPSSGTVSVTLRLYRGDGQELAASVTQNIVANGVLQSQASTLFPAADLLQAQYARATSTTAAIAAAAVIKGLVVPNDVGVVNGVDRSSTVAEANFPHVINGLLAPAAYTTVIGVTNLSSTSQTVTIIFTPNVGTPIVVPQPLAAGGSLRATAKELFNLGADFQDGWVKVIGSAGLTAFAAYGDTIGGAFAIVPAGTAKTNMLFAHIADGPSGLPANWETGLALLNAGNTTATFDVFAMTPAGQLIGSKTGVTLGPGKKTALQLHSLITQVTGVNGGFVFARSNVPLFALEVFYTASVTILSNVSALPLAPGITYTPPSSGGGGGGGGGGGVIPGSGPASACIDTSIYSSVSNIHVEYTVTGVVPGTIVTDSVSRLNVVFEGQTTTEIVSTSNTNFAGLPPAISSMKGYHRVEGTDLLTFGSIVDVIVPVGTVKSVYSPPARDRRYSLALGDSDTQTYDLTTTTNYEGLPPSTVTTSMTGTVRYLGRESVTVPAGTFDTCKFDQNNGSNTIWIAAGSSRGAIIKSTSTNTGFSDIVVELKAGSINGAAIRP